MNLTPPPLPHIESSNTTLYRILQNIETHSLLRKKSKQHPESKGYKLAYLLAKNNICLIHTESEWDELIETYEMKIREGSVLKNSKIRHEMTLLNIFCNQCEIIANILNNDSGINEDTL